MSSADLTSAQLNILRLLVAEGRKMVSNKTEGEYLDGRSLWPLVHKGLVDRGYRKEDLFVSYFYISNSGLKLLSQY